MRNFMFVYVVSEAASAPARVYHSTTAPLPARLYTPGTETASAPARVYHSTTAPGYIHHEQLHTHFFLCFLFKHSKTTATAARSLEDDSILIVCVVMQRVSGPAAALHRVKAFG